MPPTLLMQSLDALRRKVKLLGVAYGVGLLLASAVALLLGAVLLDYLLNLPAVPRLVVVLAALGAIGYVLVRYVLRPAMSRLTIGDVAGRLETTFPQFDDRLRSTVNFLRSDGGRDVSGSDVMKQRVITEAGSMAASVDLNRALVMRPVWYSAGAGAGAVGVLILLAVAISPLYRNIALSRLFTPFAGAAWPKRVQIDMVNEVPKRLPVGQRVELKMRLAKGDRASMKAVVHYQYGTGPWQQELMTRGADGTYAASLDARVDAGANRGAMNVRIVAGDDAKTVNPIEILPRLAVTRVEAVVTPPKYVRDGSAQQAVNLTQGPAVMPIGSAVALHLSFNKPLAASENVKLVPVSEDIKLPPIAWETNEQTVTGTFAAADSLRFHVIATDADGFRNSGIEEYELIVKPDQAPTVQIEVPRRNEERTPVATVPLQAIAEDDYGVSGLKLVVDRISGAKQHWEIDLVSGGAPVASVQWANLESSGDRRRFRANYAWDLSQLSDANLQPGDVLEYHLLVKDNFDLAGEFHEPAPSGKLRVTIISQEQLVDAITNELRTIAGQITEVHNGQNRTKEETSGLAKETEQKPELDAGDRAAIERLGGQQSTAASQTKQVAGKLETVQERLAENKSLAQELNDLARDVKDVMNKTAEEPMKDAVAKLGMAHQEKLASPQRNETLGAVVATQQQAADNLQRALDRMQNIGSLQTAIDRFKNLLTEQQKVSKDTRDIGKANLGKTPEQMSDADRKKLEENARDQETLAGKTQKALDALQKTADQMAKADPASAQAMSTAAKMGQTQQVSPNQKQAAAQAKQNQQAQAQNAQGKAELGLEMIIKELGEAERRKLEELSKKLEELQKQIANLIRRQAGHNLDNLRIQGPDRVLHAGADLLRDLTVKAERPLPDDTVVKDSTTPAPEMGPYTASQEQTERNARDIATTVEAVPNGSEPAARLTRAAGKMERAIVSLRAKKLAEAYEPPQVEALAELEEAKRIVDEQKREIDQKKDQQKKEAIRQVYVKIKAEQELVNTDTARIDVLRAQGRDLPRNETIRLGQLPVEQGKLSKRTNELEEDLAALGSIIYIWANKDIVGSMDLVKDDLAKPATGVPTRAEQTRVVEQLDSMIKNLAIKPMERKFESPAGGGGGGACPPMLPTESELRLLKDLQLAINKSTKTSDAEQIKDQPRLLALGARQGELRNLLDETIKKASNGNAKLGPEPDPNEQLPEEAGKEQIETQELVDDLLQGAPDPEKIMKGTADVGQRMARSRQRLALNGDPGKVTQLIQDRIILDLDGLIEQARKQEGQPGQPDPQMAQKPGEKKDGKRPTGVQANNQGKNGQSKPNAGANPADQSTPPGASATNTDLAQTIKESSKEWGRLSPRTRDAVLEGDSEQVVEKYRKLVEDYYRGVSTERQ